MKPNLPTKANIPEKKKVGRKPIPRSSLGKRCTKCGEIKNWEDFQKKRNTLDGHQEVCRLCRSNYNLKTRPRESNKLGYTDIDRTAKILEELENSGDNW